MKQPTRMKNRAGKRKSPSPFDKGRNLKPGLSGTFSTKLRIGAAAVVLSVLAILCYANGLENGFVWDDHQQVVMNASLRPGSPIGHLFGASAWGLQHPASRHSNYYRPLQMLAYRLTADAFGFDARAFHTVNLTFHVLAVLLAFAVFWKLTRRVGVSFAAAALFAVYPVHSEAIDWIAALPDIGCSVFFLLAFLLLVLARNRLSPAQQVKQSRLYRVLCFGASCLAFAAALLWKETAMVFPFIVMAYSLYLGEPGSFAGRLRDAVKLSLSYWVILIAYFVLRFQALGFIMTRQRNWILSPIQFALTVINLFSDYWLKLLAPIHLNAYYLFSPVLTLVDPRAIVAILFLIAAIVVAYRARRSGLAIFAMLWVCITVIPVLDVFAVGRNVFCERYLYLPSVGFCLLVVLFVDWAGQRLPVRLRWPLAAVALAAVLVLFTLENTTRNPDWRDDSTLFTHTLESSPNAPFVQNMVAAFPPNDETGQASAEAHYLRAISLAQNESPPDRSEIAFANEGLASIYASRGDFNRALRALEGVRAADPQDPEVDGEEGIVLAQAGRWPQAEAALRKAVAAAPDDPNVLNALGLVAWHHDHDLDRAVAYFSRALALHTDADDFQASLHNNLGAIYGELGRFSEAIAQFQLALKISPNDPEYLTNLGTAFLAIGRLNEARTELQTALFLAPDYQPARDALREISRR